jgi:hypothetical protein
VDNPVDKNLSTVEKLFIARLPAHPKLVDNSGFSVDNPAGTVYKILPNLWKTMGYRTPNLWIVCE